MSQSVTYLLWQAGRPESSPQSHTNSQLWWFMLVFPMLGSGRQTDPRNSLTSQLVLIIGPQIKVREILSETKQNKTNKNEVPEEQNLRLTSDLCTHMHTGTLLPHLLGITATKLYKQTGKQTLLKNQKAKTFP